MWMYTTEHLNDLYESKKEEAKHILETYDRNKKCMKSK